MKRILLFLMTLLLTIDANAFSGEVEIDGFKYYIVGCKVFSKSQTKS